MIKRLALIALLTFAGRVSAQDARPADSLLLSPPEPRELQEVTVRATGPRRVIRHDSTGAMSISGRMLGEQPSLTGAPDAVALLRTLPAVATSNDLQAALNVRGSSTGSNLYEADGVRIVAPMHLLGLFSAYNPAYYRAYGFNAGSAGALTQSLTAGHLAAETFDSSSPDSTFTGSVSVGLIESHLGVRIPLARGRSSLAVGARRTYLDLLFSDILKLGDSHIDYGFTDLNVGFHWSKDERELKVNVFANRDRMGLRSDKNGTKEGDFGWSNLAGSVRYRFGAQEASFGATYFRNRFDFSEGGRRLLLPGSLLQLTGRWMRVLGRGFEVEGDVNYRRTGGQSNQAASGLVPDRSLRSFEGNAAGQWRGSFGPLNLRVGLRLAYYHCGSYNTLVPQPRVGAEVRVAEGVHIHAAYGRYVRFDRLVEESSGGLPADFWTSATESVRPEDVHSFELGAGGVTPRLAIRWRVDGYYKILRHQGEFAGSILSLVNASFDPVADGLLDGRGYAWGVSVSLMRQVGKLRGRIGYNYGRSRLRFDRYGEGYFPSSHDRPHDLNATLTWQPLRPLTLGASFTYATGTPYTRARYGYMIGGNLICEYFPHNSSRLPSYRRLDFSASWRFEGRRGAAQNRITHIIGVSVYNALASRNVLFTFTSYSLEGGIFQRRSVMKAVIPSVSYTVEF